MGNSITYISGNRQTGKTTALIKIAAEKDLRIISLNLVMVNYTMKRAKELGLAIRTPITHERFVDGTQLLGIKENGYALDDFNVGKHFIDTNMNKYKRRDTPILAIVKQCTEDTGTACRVEVRDEG